MVSYLWRALKTHHVQPCARGDHPNTSAASAPRRFEHLVQTQRQRNERVTSQTERISHLETRHVSPELLTPPRDFQSRDFCAHVHVHACVLVVVPIFVCQFLWEGFPSWLFPGAHNLPLQPVSATSMKHLPASVASLFLNDFKCRCCWMRHNSRL